MGNEINYKGKRNNLTIIETDLIRSDLTLLEKMMYIVLSSYANSNNQCFPSIATLERDCSSSKPTVLKAIDSLIERGLLIKQERLADNNRTTSNLYTLLDVSNLTTTTTQRTSIEHPSEEQQLAAVENQQKEIIRVAITEQFKAQVADQCLCDIFAYTKNMDLSVILLAIQESAENNKPTIKYLKAILDRCTMQQIRTIEEFKLKQEEHRRKKATTPSGAVAKKDKFFNGTCDHQWDYDKLEQQEQEYINRMIADMKKGD